MIENKRDVASSTLRIHQNGWARLSLDLVADGARWICMKVYGARRCISFRTVRDEEPGAIELKFYNGRRCPLFYIRPMLSRHGIVPYPSSGTYAATASGNGSSVVDLNQRVTLRHGELVPIRSKRRKNPFQARSVRAEVFRLCRRNRGATIAEIWRIVQERGIAFEPIVRSMLAEQRHGYKVTRGPGGCIKITAPRQSDRSRNSVKLKVGKKHRSRQT
jgi:hypothetical protein